MYSNTQENTYLPFIPFPACLVNENGKVIKANQHIGDVFLYEGIENADLFALTGVKTSELLDDKEEEHILERNDKKFRIIAEEKGDNTLVFFYDVTGFESLKEKYDDEKMCVAKINIDNYDELVASTPEESRMSVVTEADKAIRKWANKYVASISRLNQEQYIMYFQNFYTDSMIGSKFAILDEVHDIETETDFPMSISIGVGIGGKNIVETEEFATSALDLALGRGGDQAVVKKDTKTEYYGGKMQTVEKSNKGKSRVVAHALKQLIEHSKRVLIMGHKHPDMDCFGAALGIYRMCIMCNKDAHIVISEISTSLEEIYKKAKESGTYSFISDKKAESIIDKDTLVVVVDTHRPSYVEDGELLKMTDKIVVIDHHRRAEDAIENATLSYIESYASSAAELVSEILQYAAPKKTLIKLEAEALLGGMTIDTNRFAVKTGVRTFEAAAWLRRAGADTTEVKKYFQTDMESFKVRAKCIAAADFYENGIATSVCEGMNEDAQIINSQVADELLNIKGIKASFVAGRTIKGKTVISARSLGELNVQVIMEKIGGGGHLTTAGAQVDISPEEVIEKVLELVNI